MHVDGEVACMVAAARGEDTEGEDTSRELGLRNCGVGPHVAEMEASP